MGKILRSLEIEQIEGQGFQLLEAEALQPGAGGGIEGAAAALELPEGESFGLAPSPMGEAIGIVGHLLEGEGPEGSGGFAGGLEALEQQAHPIRQGLEHRLEPGGAGHRAKGWLVVVENQAVEGLRARSTRCPLVLDSANGCLRLPRPVRVQPMARPIAPPSSDPPATGKRWRVVRWPSRTQVFVERIEGLELPLVRIPAGHFWMGSPAEEPQRSDSEGPQHRVEVAEFLMGQTPITQAQWRVVANWKPPRGTSWKRRLKTEPSFFQLEESGTKRRVPIRVFEGESNSIGKRKVRLFEGESNTDQRPVEQVSWHDAMEFCRRLNSRLPPKDVRRYSLPSEAQWEYACRAGTQNPFYFGETITPELVNYNGNYTYADGAKGEYRQCTTPVGRGGSKLAATFPANAWGLHDMHGNVSEWCLDCWHPSYEGAPADGSAWIGEEERNQNLDEESKKDDGRRLLRGGSWDDRPRFCRSACRVHAQPDFAGDDVGFRVVCLPQDPSLNP